MADEFVDEERVSMEEEQALGSGDNPAEGELVPEAEEGVETGGDDAGAVVEATAAAATGFGSSSDINTESFTELITPAEGVAECQRTWQLLISMSGSKEAVGEALYQALIDSAPSLRGLFVTPRAVQALRTFTQINSMINTLGTPADLKMQVESLGFWHLSMDVTVPRCIVFRDCIVDLFVAELGSKLTSSAIAALSGLLNYVAGAIMYCKLNFATRLRILNESWSIANDKGGGDAMNTMERSKAAKAEEDAALAAAHETSKDAKGKEADKKAEGGSMVQNVPTTYKEMFQFNAAVCSPSHER